MYVLTPDDPRLALFDGLQTRTPTTLDGLRQTRSTLIEEITALTGAEDFDPKDKTFLEARSRADDLDAKIETLVKWEQSRSAANKIDALQINARRSEEQKRDEVDAGLSIGELWTRSAQWTDYRERPRGNSGILTVPWDSLQTRAPILTTTYAGVLQKDRISPSAQPAAQTPLLDLVGQVQVSQNAVEWVYYPAAAPLADVVAEGAQKPEATVTLTLKTVNLDTIAHWVKYSRQFAQDSNLGPFIDEELRRGVRDKMEANTASTLTGSADVATSTYGGTDLMEAVRVMVGEVVSAGYQPRNIVLNPADHAKLDWDVFTNTLRGPTSSANFWGVTPVPVGAVPAGTVFVGDFGVGMKWLARQDATIYTTDSDISGAGATAASDFRANILTTLAEGRGKAVVHRGEAIFKKSGLTVLTQAERGSGTKQSDQDQIDRLVEALISAFNRQAESEPAPSEPAPAPKAKA